MEKLLLLEKDEDLLKRLEDILFNLDENVVVFSRTDIREAYRCVVKVQIDLFIVDVTLKADSAGFPPELKFIDKIRRSPKYRFTPILLVTEVKDTLLYTYERLNCYKFIDKPVDGRIFRKAVEDSLRFLATTKKESIFCFQWNNVAYKVNKSSIVYMQMIDEKLYIHLNDGKVRCAPTVTMEMMLNKLDDSDFLKCHRSTIVNMNYIESVDIGKQTIRLKDGGDRLSIGITFIGYMEEIMRVN